MIQLRLFCMILILFMAAVYFSGRRVHSHGHVLFSASLGMTAFNLLFDMITVYTVNHLKTVPEWINRPCHILFLGSMIMEFFLCFLYISTLIYENDAVAREKNRFMYILVCVAWLGLIFLPLGYVETAKGNYSWGPAVFMVYGFLILCMALILGRLVRYWKRVEPKKRRMVVLALGILLVFMAYQAFFPFVLLSGAGLTLLNLAFFMTVESPDVLLMEKLKEEKERADEANEAKSRFLSNMSHEIRTPMNAIVGLTEVLLRKEWPPQEKRYLSNIKSSGDALLNLINDLLDFSKIEAGKFVITEEDYEPLAMLEDLKVIFLNRIGDKKIDLKYDIDPQLPRVLYGDGMRIRQVIINLVNNAIKFTESGYVSVSLQVKHRRQDAVELCVSVQDSGQGIKKEDLDKLFDAFTQVDIKKNHAKEGTGLGLAICRQLVELMDGTLNVRSEYGKGSDFYFVLWQKAVSKETVSDMEKETETKPVRRSELGFTAPGAKVLVVDDNELNREVAAALLEPLKMQIDTAENGMEAYQMVQQKEYDMVFMDHYMPVMDGIEAVKAIRQLDGAYYGLLPIIALTADAIAGEREKFIAAGMNDLVSKPIRIKEICEKIQYYLPESLVEA